MSRGFFFAAKVNILRQCPLGPGFPIAIGTLQVRLTHMQTRFGLSAAIPIAPEYCIMCTFIVEELPVMILDAPRVFVPLATPLAQILPEHIHHLTRGSADLSVYNKIDDLADGIWMQAHLDP
jgi:hypothetical protein